MEDELREFLQRGVSALERLAEDPVIQMETAPPICPHCERMNPVIRVQESSAVGLMAEFVIQAHCTHCNNVFYAIPIHWVNTKSLQDAQQAISERAELGGYDKHSG